MAEYQTSEHAADALGVSKEQLAEMSKQDWFPPDGFVKGKGFDVAVIRDAQRKALKSTGPEVAYVINKNKFTPVCPKSVHHKTRVFRTKGRIRQCVCDDCGWSWQQVGEYSDPRAETLNRLAKAFDEAERTVVSDGKNGTVSVVVLDDKTVKDWAKHCRGAIKAKE